MSRVRAIPGAPPPSNLSLPAVYVRPSTGGRRAVAAPAAAPAAPPSHWKTILGALAVCLAITAALVVHTRARVDVLRTGYAIDRISREHDKLVQENRKLAVRAAQLRSLDRIADIARNQLGMAPPAASQLLRLAPARTARADTGAASKPSPATSGGATQR